MRKLDQILTIGLYKFIIVRVENQALRAGNKVSLVGIQTACIETRLNKP